MQTQRAPGSLESAYSDIAEQAVAVTPLLDAAIADALAIVARNRARFRVEFPDDATVRGIYPARKAGLEMAAGSNVGWTTGFVPGMYWSAWQTAGDPEDLVAAKGFAPSFIERLHSRVEIDTHDLGFLYTLSCVTAWKLLGDAEAKRAALAAADHLMTRFLEPAGIVQAWGDLGDPNQRGRTIIDSLMNMALLYWASEITGDTRYARAASRHSAQLRDNMFRADDSTFHTFFWDLASGAPLRGTTAQGFANESCWARGQAWGIYGFALNYRHTQDATFLSAAQRGADYFLAHLPADKVPYWDLVFGDGSGEERDSSAGAIAVCGLMELAHWLPDHERRQFYLDAAQEILNSLVTNYATSPLQANECLLLQGVYSKPDGKGVNEGNLWGDYFYLEALNRMRNPDWLSCW